MGATAGATLAALVGREPQWLQAQGRTNATADAVIVLWMAGGMAQTETWDPKRYTPFEPGVRTERVLSTFPASTPPSTTSRSRRVSSASRESWTAAR